MKSNIDTSRTADIYFSCLLCLRKQRLQKIDISIIIAILGYFDYKAVLTVNMLCPNNAPVVRQLFISEISLIYLVGAFYDLTLVS